MFETRSSPHKGLSETCSKVLEIDENNLNALCDRGEAYLLNDKHAEAIKDLHATKEIIRDYKRVHKGLGRDQQMQKQAEKLDGHLKISQLHYRLGEVAKSSTEIKQCLKLDPDHKKCFKHYKKVKKLMRCITDASSLISQKRFSDALVQLKAALEIESKERVYLIQLNNKICHRYHKKTRAVQAIEACTKVLNIDRNNLDALCNRGEAYLSDEECEKAIKDFGTALSIDKRFGKST